MPFTGGHLEARRAHCFVRGPTLSFRLSLPEAVLEEVEFNVKVLRTELQSKEY